MGKIRVKAFGEEGEEPKKKVKKEKEEKTHLPGMGGGERVVMVGPTEEELAKIDEQKILGSFELGTGVIINTQDPKETFEFVKDHFNEPDLERIRENRAEYHRKA